MSQWLCIWPLLVSTILNYFIFENYNREISDLKTRINQLEHPATQPAKEAK